MKKCSSCLEEKPNTEFHKQKRSPDGYNTRCAPCKNNRENDRYHRNKKFVQRYKLFIGCTVCGYSRDPYALELAHLDGEDKWCRSDEGWSHAAGKAVKYEWSRKKIKNEIRKCKVLCANCHREDTYDYTSS